MRLSGKKIVLGVTGCIAAYKACYLLRSLIREGAEVRTVMTRSACKFVTALTFESLSGQPVSVEMFPDNRFTSVHHIHLAEWADLILVAPATANILGKTASGVSDDLLTTIICAAQSPVMFAPAMNSFMWTNPVTQGNVSKLKALGYRFVEPVAGDLASWAKGPGRFPEPESIVEAVVRLLSVARDFDGQRVLVTAGPTYEFIDPVRFIGNPSTGAMGYAIAEAAKSRGAKVSLVSGPTMLNAPPVDDFCSVVSTEQMFEAVKERVKDCNILVMAAAPADYTSATSFSKTKIKKSDESLALNLSPTVDILKKLSRSKGKRVFVGFALETDNEITNARKKLLEKNLDMIIVNNPTEEGAGFGPTTNKVTILSSKSRPERLPLMAKRELADKILDRVSKILGRTR